MTVLKHTIFKGSLKGEQILSDFTKSYDKDPEVIAFRSELAKQEAIYNARVLDAKAVQSWVQTLRSGKYLQKDWAVRDRNGKWVGLRYYKGGRFSALGVLCEITKDLTDGKWHGSWFLPKDEQFTKGSNQSEFKLPPFVEQKLGFKRTESDLIGDINELARMNAYYSFKELADIIESEYLTNN